MFKKRHPVIRELGIEAIGGYTKDLEIAAWLTEAVPRPIAVSVRTRRPAPNP